MICDGLTTTAFSFGLPQRRRHQGPPKRKAPQLTSEVHDKPARMIILADQHVSDTSLE